MATIIPIYNLDTEEQIPPYLEKLEERLNNLCESNPEMGSCSPFIILFNF